ncbi:MAG: endonuclease V [Gemmatimonas sp. SG8_17]|nr:MAG: endonuclease V [Gemmatimonas sp. SG8_17]
MKIPPTPHSWSVTPSEAIAIQQRLAKLVTTTAPQTRARFVAGADAVLNSDRTHCIAGVVLWDLDQQTVVEQRTAVRELIFPYVPGLLAFREAPAVLAALAKLRNRPDTIMCDAHGLAHPRRFGLACHVGVICDMPALGCAKSRLVGTYCEPGSRRGSTSLLTHEGEVIAAILRTRPGVKPVFVSVGHRCDLEAATSLVLACAVRFRLPEPTRLADRLVARTKHLC